MGARGVRLVASLLMAVSLMGSSAAWCFCLPPAAPAASAHACCDEGAGLVAGDRHCCQTAPEAKGPRVIVVPAGPPALSVPAAAVAVSPPSMTPALPRALSHVAPPTLTLRI